MPILKRIPVTPSLPGIGGCQLWLDAGDTSSITLSSSSVTQWNDKSGNARHYTTLGSAPVYSSAAGGSVTFSQGQRLQNSATWSGNGAGVDIFIVTTPWLNTQYSDWRTLFRGYNAGHRVILLYNGTSFGYYANNGGGFFQYGSLTLDNTKTLIYVKTDSSFVTSAAFNGNFALSAAGSTQDSDANPFYCLGAYQGGPSQAWGTINEVIIFSNLAAPERQQVEGYLANKWALGSLLPIGHAGKKDRMTLLPGGPTSRSGQIRLIPPLPVVAVVSGGLIQSIDGASYTSGSTWTALVGNNQTVAGTLTTTATPGGPNAVVFSGSAYAQDLTGITSSTMYSYSIDTWFYAAASATGTIIGEQGQGSIGGWNVRLVSVQSGSITVGFWQGSVYTLNLGSYSTNTWTHVSYTYNSSTNSVVGYVNGVYVATGSSTKQWPGTNYNTIGGASNPTPNFTGRIGAYKLYNVILTADQVKQNYNALASRFGLSTI